MSVRRSAWSVYDIFTSKDGEKVFVGVVSDSLWQRFCAEFELTEFAGDPEMERNNERVKHRDTIIPHLQALFAQMSKEQLMARLDSAGVPFAPINKPIDLVDDPHMLQGGGLMDITLNTGETIKLPGLPLEFNGHKADLHKNLPNPGQGALEHLEALGIHQKRLAELVDAGVIIAQ
jgi:crotonobetainyl-CoA:carnitine CoA-transferase CaiB-like acyl-CoA transferase